MTNSVGSGRRVLLPTLELLSMSAWLLICIGVLRVKNPAEAALAAVGVAILVAVSMRRTGERFAEVAMAPGSLKPALVRIACVVLPALVIVLLVAAYLGSMHFPPPTRALASLVQLVVFGSLQQYILLTFLYRRALEALGSDRLAMPLVAMLFSLFHWPNPLLVCVCFAAGLAACWIYKKGQNIPAIGIAHGVLTFCLYYGLPRDITHNLRVGPGFFAT